MDECGQNILHTCIKQLENKKEEIAKEDAGCKDGKQ